MTNPLYTGLPPAIVRMKARRDLAAFRAAQQALKHVLEEQQETLDNLARAIRARDTSISPPSLQ